MICCVPYLVVENRKWVPVGAHAGCQETPPPPIIVWTLPSGMEISKTFHSVGPLLYAIFLPSGETDGEAIESGLE
jgi:hypothetical protein